MIREIYFAALVSLVGLRGAVVLDRIAAVVGKHAIKSSDIERDLRLTEFLNREKLDLSSDARRKAADRLIEQAIIRDEIANGGYRRPTDSDVDALLKQMIHDRSAGSETKFRNALAEYGVTENQLRAQLLWQLTVLRFIDQRFRAGVLLTDEEVRAFYDEKYPKSTAFEAAQPKIRATLEGERVNENFIAWLDQARKRNTIEYKRGAFE